MQFKTFFIQRKKYSLFEHLDKIISYNDFKFRYYKIKRTRNILQIKLSLSQTQKILQGHSGKEYLVDLLIIGCKNW